MRTLLATVGIAGGVIVVCLWLYDFYSTHRCVEWGQGVLCTPIGNTVSCLPTRECMVWERK